MNRRARLVCWFRGHRWVTIRRRWRALSESGIDVLACTRCGKERWHG